MVTAALLLFAATILLGAITYRRSHARGRWIPALGTSHALLGLLALLLLITAAVDAGNNLWLNTAVFLFGLTVLGGGFAFLVRKRGEAPILPIVLLHASMGTVAFLVLLGGR
jgi:hypothetical protein